jgi:hypothetical protein
MLETDDGGAVTARVIVYQEAEEGSGRLEGKFLQLALRGQAYVLFASTKLHRYHSQLLARFLAEQQIPHRWATPEMLVVGSAEVVVHGGGRFRVDTAARRLTLWDNSQAYGRFDACTIAAQLPDSGHAWGDFEVRIE